MLWLPSAGYGWQLSSQSGVRPATNYGDSVVPAQNAKTGAWTQLFTGAEIAHDVYGIVICINSNNVTGSARDTLLDIGIDPAGGTAYTVRIPDLLCAAACNYTDNNAGVWYEFPLFIPAGSTIAARASVNNATVGTLRVLARVFGKPDRPDVAQVGQYVTAFGINAATSTGTAFTPGQASEGVYVSLGTTARDHWWWQLGMGSHNSGMNPLTYHLDLAYGGITKVTVLEDVVWVSLGTAEKLGNVLLGGPLSGWVVPSGQELHARGQCSGSPDGSLRIAAYGLGG